MIVKMNKYTLVLYHREQQAFLNKLQELGLVDVTTTGWEPDEKEREMLGLVNKHADAVADLRAMASAEDFVPGDPFKDGDEAYERYVSAVQGRESLAGKINKAEKELEELKIWGDFSLEQIEQLATKGVYLQFFSCYTSDFNSNVAKWAEAGYVVEKINEANSNTYFVAVVLNSTEPLAIDAQQMKMPTESIAQKEQEIAKLEAERDQTEKTIARCAASADLIESAGRRIAERLQFSQVKSSGQQMAEGSLIVMEGWGTEEDSGEIDSFLEKSEGVVYIKEKPSAEDNVPVKLKNNAFARPFEFIGQLYSLPKYGTTDLTKYFGPFYMLFFGICLGDAGYGLLLVLGGLYMLKKMPKMREIAKLTLYCGGMTVLCGFIVGSFFGISLPGLKMFANYKDYFLTTDNLFYMALALGGVQILFAMAMNVVGIIMRKGFKYSFGPLGWFIMLVATAAAALLPAELGFTLGSVAYIVVMIIGAVLMLLLNNPNRNIFKNFMSGLWDTYNNVVGVFGDILSYIRLFALCLSGGTLALVFNDLAFGMAPDIPVVKQLFVVIILIFGHGINLFMSAIGAFVHPMRLTFVEFYKNAGFEAAARLFTPFKKEKI